MNIKTNTDAHSMYGSSLKKQRTAPLPMPTYKRNTRINATNSRQTTTSYTSKYSRSPSLTSSKMGNGVSLTSPSHNGTSGESRALPPGPSGPQGLRGEVMSRGTLPSKRDIFATSRSATATPVITGDGRPPFGSSSVLHRTGSHNDLRSTSPHSKYPSLNGRSNSASKNASSSLSRSKRLASSNSTINSSTASSDIVSRSSLSRTDYADHSLPSDLMKRLNMNENNASNGEIRELSERSYSSGSIATPSVTDGMMKRGLIGLKNLGNTCFMNSVLQCLSNSRPLLEFCLNRRYEKDLNTTTSSMQGWLFKAYAELTQQMWSSSCSTHYVAPTQFKNKIQKFAPRFMGYSQQDAQEFLRYLLQGLHEDVNRVRRKEKPTIPNYDEEDKMQDEIKSKLYWDRLRRLESSFLQDLFTGQLKSTLKCDVCGYGSTTFDPFWDLSLPIPKRGVSSSGQTLEDCIKLFTAKEVLDGDEKPTCARCKARRRCTKFFTIQSFPKLLVLHLKRFSGERSRSKIQSRIDYPLTGLDLSSFGADSCKKTPIYNLYAVSCHSGSVHSGHYTAYVRHAYNGHWYDFDDTRVSSPLNARSVVCAEGYVLFYEQENGT